MDNNQSKNVYKIPYPVEYQQFQNKLETTLHFISLSKKISKDIIYNWLDILNDATNQMRFSTQKRAFLEL